MYMTKQMDETMFETSRELKLMAYRWHDCNDERNTGCVGCHYQTLAHLAETVGTCESKLDRTTVSSLQQLVARLAVQIRTF
jgi:hypothetical protein